MSVLDICDALALVLEPLADPNTVVVLDTEPGEFEQDRLYVWPTRWDEVPFETSSARRQEFDVLAVYMPEAEGEEATGERSRDLADLLDAKRAAYMAAIRHNQTTTVWGFIRAAVEAAPVTIQSRGAQVRVSGWRIVN